MKDQYSSTRIRLHIDIEEAIDIVDLSNALLALNKQYNKYLKSSAKTASESLNPEDAHLFLTKIENKCIEAEIAGATTTFLGAAMPLLKYHNTFRGFIDYFTGYIKCFASRTFEKEPSKSDCTDYSSFLEAASKARKGAIDMELVEYDQDTGEKKTELRYQFASDEVVKARQNALLLAEKGKEEESSDLKFQTLYFPQINANESTPHIEGARSHDRGIVQNVTKKALPVFWASEMDSTRVKSYAGNPFKAAFIVDVNIGYKGDNPTHYTIVNLHDIIEDDSNGQKELDV